MTTNQQDVNSSDPTQVFPLETVSASGAVPKKRLTDAKKAQQIYFTIQQANQLRNMRGTFVQAMFDNNPPYQQSLLRQNGQGWRANFNRGEGKARKDAAKAPFYDLFSTAPLYADCQTKVRGQLTAAEASGVISEEFDYMLREWAGFDFNIWQMLDDFVGFGKGFLFFPQMDSWRFKRVQWNRAMFPDGTGVDTEEWQLFTIEHNFSLTTLNGYVKDSKFAAAAGWNIDRVHKAIYKAVPKQPNATQNDTLAIQQAIREQDIYTTTAATTVQAASIFTREFDGSWSWMIVETEIGSDKSAIGTDDWLFSKHGAAKTIEQLLASFFFDVENGYVNGLGGLGRDIFDVVKVGDRIACEAANNVFLRSTVLLQAQSANSALKTGLIQVGGGVTVIPTGMQVQQSTILGDVEGSLAYENHLSRNLDVNTGVYRPSFEKPPGNPETLGAAQMRFSQATVLSSSAVNRFYQQLDKLYKEIYRRASMKHAPSSDAGIKSAIEFQKRCIDRGVSEAQLRGVHSVKAMRSIGNGSPSMRQQMTSEIGAIVPQLGQRGQMAWRQDFIAARGGQSKVDRYMPPEDAADLPSEQDREALQENNSVKGGSMVVIIENDNHEVHLRRHFEAAFGALQAVQQGGPPQDAAAFIAGIIPHIQEHIALVPFENIQKEATQTLRELESQYSQLLSAIEANTPDTAEQGRVMSEIELQAMKTQASIADRQTKTAATIQDRNLKTAHGLQLAEAKTASAISQQTATTKAQIALDSAKTVADIRAKRAKAAATPAKPKSK